jgi:putative copper resistance protein D
MTALLASSGPPTTTMPYMPAMGPMPGMANMPPAATHSGGSHGTVAHHMAGMGTEPRIDAHTLVSAWQGGFFPIAVAVALAALALCYVLATRRLAGRGRAWSRWRTTSFLASLVAVEVALGGSVAVLSNYSFTAHVIQHLLLMVVAPPLAALGAPMTLALQTSKRRTKRFLLGVLRSPVFAVISHPAPVFFLYYLAMYAFFLTGAFDYAMTHMWLMDLINLGFLGGATLFWWPMVGLDPIPHWRLSPGLKLLNLLVGVPIESFLGIIIMMMGAPAASMYTLASTHYGGGVLWVGTELATVGAIIPMFAQWSRADLRNAKRVDARIEAGGGMTPPVFEGHGMAATFRSLRRG